MPEKTTFYYATLQCVHALITRAIQVTIENAQEFLQNGFPDKTTHTGYYRYVYSTNSLLDGHFRTTDEIVFPYFQSKLPALRLSTITEQHQQMKPHVNAMKTAVEGINSPEAGDALKQLLDASNKLNVLWLMHINTEEDYFASDSVITQQLSGEEQDEISTKTVKFSKKFYEPASWIIPFVLYNLPPKQREIMSRNMSSSVSSVIIDKVLPTVWRNEWAPMKPFLLEV